MCDICKTKSATIYASTLHFTEFEPLNLKLCFKHDVELFKRGQVSFLRIYAQELQDVIQKTKSAGTNSDLSFG
jgi:hypothetical protein